MVRRDIKKFKGITVVEVLISFVIATILIMSLYIIVYWGNDTNVVNEKVMEINSIMTYIQQDMINNTPLYFELDNGGNLVIRQDIDVNQLITLRIRQVYKVRSFVGEVRLVGLESVPKPGGMGISGNNFDNIYRVTIQVVWVHKNRLNTYTTGFLISSYSLKRITSRQTVDEGDLRIDLPDVDYIPLRVFNSIPRRFSR